MNSNHFPCLLPSCPDGQALRLWHTARRDQVLKMMEEIEYGTLPPELHAAPGEVEACRWAEHYVMQRLCLRCLGGSFHLEVYIPKGVARCPVVLYLLLHGETSNALPIKHFLDAECAFAYLSCDEVAEDVSGARDTGLFLWMRQINAEHPATAGALAAWAWGLAQAKECLAAHASIDAHRIALVGYSRGGKAALWSCARYGGYALCVAVHSGCGGASMYRTIPQTMERLGDIVQSFPAWFSPAFGSYAGREEDLPFDQHMLLALCAPSRVLILDADHDPYCCADSDHDSVMQAQPIFTMCGGNVEQIVGEGDHTFRQDEWNKILRAVKKLP